MNFRQRLSRALHFADAGQGVMLFAVKVSHHKIGDNGGKSTFLTDFLL
jgi:hypothetical protein